MRNWSSICPKMSFDSVPAAVQTGTDFAARCITISDERAESIKTGSEKGRHTGPARTDFMRRDTVYPEGRECAGQ